MIRFFSQFLAWFCVILFWSVQAWGAPVYAQDVANDIISEQALFAQNRNSVLLRCRLGDVLRQTRAVVLRTGEGVPRLPGYEIALTTGHGLEGDPSELLKTCSVLDAQGKLQTLRHIAFAPHYQPGTPSDWAVIVFKENKKGGFVRYRLPDFVSSGEFANMASRHLRVKFSRAIGLPYNLQDCELVPRKIAGLQGEIFLGFIAHDCDAVPGQSGSPVSVYANGVSVILGIHVGRSFSLGQPRKNEPARFFGYMRIIDEGLMHNLNTLLIDIDNDLSKN